MQPILEQDPEINYATYRPNLRYVSTRFGSASECIRTAGQHETDAAWAADEF